MSLFGAFMDEEINVFLGPSAFVRISWRNSIVTKMRDVSFPNLEYRVYRGRRITLIESASIDLTTMLWNRVMLPSND